MLIVHYLEVNDSRVEEARGEVRRGQRKLMCVKGHGEKMQRKCLRLTPRALLLSYIMWTTALQRNWGSFTQFFDLWKNPNVWTFNYLQQHL